MKWQVVIEPRSIGDFGFGSISEFAIEADSAKRAELYRARCEEIAREVKRHVDGVGSVSVEPVYDDDEIAPCEEPGCRGSERHDCHVKSSMTLYDHPDLGEVYFCAKHAETAIGKLKTQAEEFDAEVRAEIDEAK